MKLLPSYRCLLKTTRRGNILFYMSSVICSWNIHVALLLVEINTIKCSVNTSPDVHLTQVDKI